MKNLSEKHMIEISHLIDKYIANENYEKARKILIKEIEKYPSEHWLYTTLANVYYEMRSYEKAFEFSKKALKMEPLDFLVLNNHACILSVMEGKELEAIDLLVNIVNTDLNVIAYGQFGEGMRWAKSLVNDCRARLAMIYRSTNQNKEAIMFFEEHLANRKKGLFSNFEKKDIIKRMVAVK